MNKNQIFGTGTMMILLIFAGCTSGRMPGVTIHLVGDSTMADKPDPVHNPERGWGQMLHLYFNHDAVVRNHAVNGRSARSFIDEGRWNNVIRDLKPGDYVFIQFGHNDQKAYDPARYGNPYSSYGRDLELMVTESLRLGAHPVILSSIVRRNFNEEGTLVDTHGAYPFVARQVAERMGVPFIDLQQSTEDLVEGLGPVRSKALYMILDPGEYEMYPEGRIDNTHLNVSGATEVAGMVAARVKEMDLPLAGYLAPIVDYPRILLITGGHAYDTTEFYDLFSSMENIRLDTLSHPHARKMLASEYIFVYDVVVQYDYQPDAPVKDSALYRNLSLHGMPMLFLHHAVCSYQQWEGFKELTGGIYVLQGNASRTAVLSDYAHDLDLQIRVAAPAHPVTAGMADFTIHDEGYSNMDFRDGITPLLTTGHPESSSPVAWLNRCDQSSVVTLLLGHDRQAYENPAFNQFLENAIRWLAVEG